MGVTEHARILVPISAKYREESQPKYRVFVAQSTCNVMIFTFLFQWWIDAKKGKKTQFVWYWWPSHAFSCIKNKQFININFIIQIPCDTIKAFVKTKHIFLLFRRLGVVYQARRWVTRRPTKKKIQEQTLSLAVIIVKLFYTFWVGGNLIKKEKLTLVGILMFSALWRARQDQRPHWQIYQKGKPPGRFKR